MTTYLQNSNRLTDIENKFMVTKGERGEGGINQEFRINRYTLLYIKQINKVLPYNTGKYIQYLIITYNGKEYEKEYIYIYIYISLNYCVEHLKLTQHCKSTILQFKKRQKKNLKEIVNKFSVRIKRTFMMALSIF